MPHDEVETDELAPSHLDGPHRRTAFSTLRCEHSGPERLNVLYRQLDDKSSLTSLPAIALKTAG